MNFFHGTSTESDLLKELGATLGSAQTRSPIAEEIVCHRKALSGDLADCDRADLEAELANMEEAAAGGLSICVRLEVGAFAISSDGEKGAILESPAS